MIIIIKLWPLNREFHWQGIGAVVNALCAVDNEFAIWLYFFRLMPSIIKIRTFNKGDEKSGC